MRVLRGRVWNRRLLGVCAGLSLLNLALSQATVGMAGLLMRVPQHPAAGVTCKGLLSSGVMAVRIEVT
ncbi:hypothetical protein GCM10010228_02180 [Streptomyces massasporeus]|nr:hypothetical protein GCM10010228_02180 [Streptomyces massasporeus]